MQLVSTFFNNEKYYMNNILKWYRNIWNIDKFIFFVGKNKLAQFNYTFDAKDVAGVWNNNGDTSKNFLVREEEDIIFYEYVSDTNDPVLWSQLKHFFLRPIIIKEHNIQETLWVDCDEFIYAKNIDKIIKNGNFHAHFYEYVPKKQFNLDSVSLWSECPWYYREQSLGKINLSHQNCKSWDISQETCGGVHMGYSNTYCDDNCSYNDYDNICFHVGVHSKEHFLLNKHWLQTDKMTLEIKNVDRNSDKLTKIFDTYYFDCKFDTFELNLSEKYLKNKNNND
jgi:hypothetical protein